MLGKKSSNIRQRLAFFDYDITYVRNSHGFREREFSDVDWNNSILLLGCSNVYGVGLKIEHPIPRLLENFFKVPVINLGIPGSSTELPVFNSFQIFKSGYRPRAIIHAWTNLDRYTYFINIKNRECVSYVPRIKRL